LAIVAAACSGADTADTSAVTTTATTIATTTTTTSTVVTETPQQLADRLIISQAEAPEGFVVADEGDDDGTACDGVDDVSTRFPAAGERSVDLDGEGHVFSAQAFVYETDADAAGAFSYAQELATLCEGGISTGDDGETSQLAFAAVEPPTAAVDEAGGYELTVFTPGVGVVLQQYFVRSGNVALVAAGTDATTALGLLDVMIAKLTGADPPSIAAPAGGPTLVPGFGVVGDGTGSVSAGVVRSAIAGLPELSEAAATWVDGATDAQIDDLALRACETLGGLGEGDDINQALQGLYLALPTEDQATLDPLGYGQVVGASLVIYCPDVFEMLGL
jgi:hypothetical protein